MVEVCHSETASIGSTAQADNVLVAEEGLAWDDRKAARRVGGFQLRDSCLDVLDSRRVGNHLVEVGVAEADGIAVPAVKVFKVQADVVLIALELETGRRREVWNPRQEVADNLSKGLVTN